MDRTRAYYNENNKYAAAWLRELIKAELIAHGDVDDRSIADVQGSDLVGYRQCHFFAGLGGWSYALRLAGWPDDRHAWTGSCPCQQFSHATRGRATAADVWPEFRRLIAECSPSVIFGEQVAAATKWFDGVCADLEAVGYEIGAAVLPAVALGADHARPRIYFVGHTNGHSQSRCAEYAEAPRMPDRHGDAGGLLPTNGVSRDVVALSGFGNAIVPQVAAEVIRAFMDVPPKET